MGLNNIAKQGWDYINKVAKNISVNGIEKSWNAYMVPTSKELAEVSRKAIQKKNTILSNLDIDAVNNAYINASNKTSDYTKEFNRLKSAIDAENADEAKKVATNIADRFNDDSFLNFLNNAEDKTNQLKSRYSEMPAQAIRQKSIKNTKQKIKDNKLANTFLNDKQQDKLAENVYKMQGYMPQNYFATGDIKKNQIRANVAIGGYMGISATTRILNGGSLFENEYGERDIVGIPFI